MCRDSNGRARPPPPSLTDLIRSESQIHEIVHLHLLTWLIDLSSGLMPSDGVDTPSLSTKSAHEYLRLSENGRVYGRLTSAKLFCREIRCHLNSRYWNEEDNCFLNACPQGISPRYHTPQYRGTRTRDIAYLGHWSLKKFSLNCGSNQFWLKPGSQKGPATGPTTSRTATELN